MISDKVKKIYNKTVFNLVIFYRLEFFVLNQVKSVKRLWRCENVIDGEVNIMLDSRNY